VKGDAGLLDWSEIIATLPGGVVIIGRACNGCLAELGFLGFNDIADIQQSVIPGILRKEGGWGVMKNQVGDVTTGQGRDYLLIESLERLDVEVQLAPRARE
jgi:hypothetical protein